MREGRGVTSPVDHDGAPDSRVRVLFLCMDDSARSQMAAGLLRHVAGDRYEAHSAGPFPAAEVAPEAVAVMRELGIDISPQRPEGARAYLGQRFDRVFAVCNGRDEPCPVFPGGATCWPIPNPADATGSAEERLRAFRAARDQVVSLMRETFGVELPATASAARTG